MAGEPRRGTVTDRSDDLFFYDAKRAEKEEGDGRSHGQPVPPGHEVGGLIIVRDDGTCTVAWGRGWGAFDRMPGVWVNLKEAQHAVERVVGRVEWTQTEPMIWEGRRATK